MKRLLSSLAIVMAVAGTVVAQSAHHLQLNAINQPPTIITGAIGGGTYTFPPGGGMLSASGTAWELAGNVLTGAPTVPIEFFGSTNNFDVVMKANNTEILRLISGAAVKITGMPLSSSSTSVVVSNGGILETRTAASLAATTSWALGGNALAATSSMGSTTPFNVNLIANGTPQVTLRSTGGIDLPATTAGGVGVVFQGGARLIHTFNNNFFAGAGAGNLTTSGSAGNVGLGNGALSGISTGFQNTAVGAGAMVSNTTGSTNTVMGFQAMVLSVSGNGNTAMGESVMQQNTNGSANTALGQFALGFNTTGSNNVAVGASAGNANTVGSSNTFIGSSANASANNLSNAIAIGANATVTASNTIQLGSGGVTNVNTAGRITSAPATHTGMPSASSSTDLVVSNAGVLETRTVASLGIGSQWLLTGNATTTPGTNFIGTTDAQAFQIHVDNANSTATNGRGRVMRFEPNNTSANIVAGFKSNSVGVTVIGGTISGGGSNGSTHSISSDYSTIGGGRGNTIGASSINATISGGVSNSVTASAGNGTIAGGLGNVIVSGDHTTVSGGFNNQILTGAFGSSLSGGTNNRTASHTSTVGGGNANIIGTSSQFSTINGGNSNFIGNSSFGSSIGGGVGDSVESSASYSTIGGGNLNMIRSSATGSTISGGLDNEIGSGATNTAIAGGRGLTLNGSGSFGFLGANGGSNNMTIAATNTAVFGNTDLWLANNRNQASELRFYDAYNTDGAFPNTSKYVGFKAPSPVTTSVTYTLPNADGSSGQVLSTNGAAALTWATPSNGISYMGGNSGGNSANATFIQIGGVGSTVVENTAQIVITRTVTLQNLFVNLNVAPGVAATKTVTIRKNGANTALTVTLTNIAIAGNSGATAVTFNAGDLLSVEIDHTGGPAASVVMIGFEMAM